MARASMRVSCAASVGATSFQGKGQMGTATFTAPAKKNSAKFLLFAGVGIGLPTVAAILTALASPVAPQQTKGPVAVTFAALALYYWVTNMVSVARYKFKVPAPATTGVSADFDRYLRAQGNTVEQLVIFLPTLWMAAALISANAATAAGCVWLIGRAMYASGYMVDAKKRGPGFGIGALAQIFLLVLSGIGAARGFIA